MAKYEVADLVRDDAKKSEGAVVSTSPAGPGLTTVVILLAASILPISYILRDEEDPPNTKNMTKARLDLDPHEVETNPISTIGKALDSTLDKNYDRITQKLKTGNYPSLIARFTEDEFADTLAALCAEDLGITPDSFAVLNLTEQRAKLEQIFNLRNAIARDYHIDLGHRYDKGKISRFLTKEIDATKTLRQTAYEESLTELNPIKTRVAKLGSAATPQELPNGSRLRNYKPLAKEFEYLDLERGLEYQGLNSRTSLPEIPSVPRVYGKSEKWTSVPYKGRRTHGVYYDAAPQPRQLPRDSGPIHVAGKYDPVTPIETSRRSTSPIIGDELELGNLRKNYHTRKVAQQKAAHPGSTYRTMAGVPYGPTPYDNTPLFALEMSDRPKRFSTPKVSETLTDADWDEIRGHYRTYQAAGEQWEVHPYSASDAGIARFFGEGKPERELAERYFDEKGNPYKGGAYTRLLQKTKEINEEVSARQRLGPWQRYRKGTHTGKQGRRPQILSVSGAVENWVEDTLLRKGVNPGLDQIALAASEASDSSSTLVDLWSKGLLEFTTNSEMLGGTGTYHLTAASAEFIATELTDHTRVIKKQQTALWDKAKSLSEQWRENFNLLNSTELSDETMLINGVPTQLTRREVAFRNMLRLQEEAAASGSSNLFNRIQDVFGGLTHKDLNAQIENSVRYRRDHGEVSHAILQQANEALKSGDVSLALSLGGDSEADTAAIRRMVEAFHKNQGLDSYIGAGYGRASEGRRALGRYEASFRAIQFSGVVDQSETYQSLGGGSLDESLGKTYELRAHLRSNFQAGPNEKNRWDATISGDDIDTLLIRDQVNARDKEVGILSERERSRSKRSSRQKTKYYDTDIVGYRVSEATISDLAPLPQTLEEAATGRLTIRGGEFRAGEIAGRVLSDSATVENINGDARTLPAEARVALRKAASGVPEDDAIYAVSRAILEAQVGTEDDLGGLLTRASEMVRPGMNDPKSYANLIIKELEAIDSSRSQLFVNMRTSRILKSWRARLVNQPGVFEEALNISTDTIPKDMLTEVEKFITDPMSGVVEESYDFLPSTARTADAAIGNVDTAYDLYLRMRKDRISGRVENRGPVGSYILSQGEVEFLATRRGEIPLTDLVEHLVSGSLTKEDIRQIGYQAEADRANDWQLYREANAGPVEREWYDYETTSSEGKRITRSLHTSDESLLRGHTVEVVLSDGTVISHEEAKLAVTAGERPTRVTSDLRSSGKIDYYFNGRTTALPGEGTSFSAFDIETNVTRDVNAPLVGLETRSSIGDTSKVFTKELAISRGYGDVRGMPKPENTAQELSMLLDYQAEIQGSDLLVGHNISGFDIGQVTERTQNLADSLGGQWSDAAIAQAGRNSKKLTLDTLMMTRAHNAPGTPAALQVQAYLMGIDPGQAHSGPDDVRTNLSVLQAQGAEAGGRKLTPGDKLAGNGRIIAFQGFDADENLVFDDMFGGAGNRFSVKPEDAIPKLGRMSTIEEGGMSLARRQQAALFLQNQIENLSKEEAERFASSKFTGKLANAMRTVGLEPEQHAQFLLALSTKDPVLKRALSNEYFNRLAAFSNEFASGSQFNLDVAGILPKHGTIGVSQDLNELLVVWGSAKAQAEAQEGRVAADIALSKELDLWKSQVTRLTEELADDPSNLQVQIRLAELKKKRPGGHSVLFEFIESVEEKAAVLEDSLLAAGGKKSLERAVGGKSAAEETRRWMLKAAVFSELSGTELEVTTNWNQARLTGIVNTEQLRQVGSNYKGVTAEVAEEIGRKSLQLGEADYAGNRLVGHVLTSYEKQGALRLQLSKSLGEDHPFDQAAALDLSRPTPVGELPEEAAAIAEKLRKEEMRGGALRNQMLGAIDNDSALMKGIRLDDLALSSTPDLSVNEGRLTASFKKLSDMQKWEANSIASNPQSSFLGKAAANAIGEGSIGMETEFLESAAKAASREARALKNAHLVDDLPLLSKSVKVAGLALGAGLGLMAAVGMLMPRKDQPGPDPGPNSTVVGPSLAEAPPIGILNQNVNVEMYDRHGKDISQIKNALRGFSTGEPDVRIADRSMGLTKEDVNQIIKNHANAI